MSNALIELGTEELPPKALSKLLKAFKTNVSQSLKDQSIPFDGIQAYGSPRRLALIIENLAIQQADQKIERRGPAVGAGFDADGKPTRALEGFAKSVSASVDQLEKEATDKGEYFIFRGEKKGQATAELLPNILHKALKALPVPKMMRWGDLDTEFVRPVQWLVILQGQQIIEAELFNVKSGNQSYGHRFHHPEAVTLQSADDYLETLEAAYVLADQNKRKSQILETVNALAAKHQATPILPEGLLEEITQIVEWPVPLLCQFDPDFLKVPAECLITALQEHQKAIALQDENGQLLPYFIAVSNIESKDPQAVISGNEKVVHARLSDAKFFFETDLKNPLQNHDTALAKLTFQAKLGSMLDKVKRNAAIAESISAQLGHNAAQAQAAALLGKSDLVTEMVMEFPELQGLMGEYYAKHQGMDSEVASALNEQYQPRFAGDVLPKTKTGIALSLADKLDTLVGIFGIGQKPTGSKDPFALRRATIGLIRILIEKQLSLDVAVLIDQAKTQHGAHLSNKTVSEDVLHFCFERLKQYYVDQGVSIETFEAVRANQPSNFYDFDCRIQAVLEFEKLPEAKALAAANKRVINILNKQGEVTGPIDENRLVENAEKALATTLTTVKSQCQPLFESRDYTAYLKALAALKTPVDAFFDGVMVMAEDEQLKTNRLAILGELKSLFGACAVLAHLSQ